MAKSTSVPTWNVEEMDTKHFGQTMKFSFSSVHSLFHINKIEDYRDKIQFPLPPHRKPVFDFLFLTKGTSRRSKALEVHDIGAGQIFFLPAYQITHHEFMSADTEGYFCHFNMEIFTQHLPQHNMLRDFPFLQYISHPIVELPESTYSFLLPLIKRLEMCYASPAKPDFELITVYLLAFFTEIKRFYTPSVSDKKSTAFIITQNFKDALSRNIYEKQKVSEYADMLAVSPNHLNKCVKTTTGQSAQDILNDMIVLEAKVLLRQTDMQINEIAYRLSQQNHSDFSRFFKLKTGLTPKEYKMNHY